MHEEESGSFSGKEIFVDEKFSISTYPVSETFEGIENLPKLSQNPFSCQSFKSKENSQEEGNDDVSTNIEFNLLNSVELSLGILKDRILEMENEQVIFFIKSNILPDKITIKQQNIKL